jgi:hypothetical protein
MCVFVHLALVELARALKAASLENVDLDFWSEIKKGRLKPTKPDWFVNNSSCFLAENVLKAYKPLFSYSSTSA